MNNIPGLLHLFTYYATLSSQSSVISSASDAHTCSFIVSRIHRSTYTTLAPPKRADLLTDPDPYLRTRFTSFLVYLHVSVASTHLGYLLSVPDVMGNVHRKRGIPMGSENYLRDVVRSFGVHFLILPQVDLIFSQWLISYNLVKKA